MMWHRRCKISGANICGERCALPNMEGPLSNICSPARALLAIIILTVGLNLAPTRADAAAPAALCRDGWVSRSSGRGTCSWHGGCIKTWTWRGYRCV